MTYWTDDRSLDLEQRRLDAQQAEALKRLKTKEEATKVNRQE